MGGLRAFFRVLRSAPKKQKRYFWITQIGVLLMVFTRLMIPFLIQRVVDDGIIAQDMGVVVKTATIMLLWSVAGFICEAIATYTACISATDLSHYLRTRLYDSVTKLSYGNLDRLSASSLLVRITSDINAIRRGWILGLNILFRAPWLLLGALVMVAHQTPQLLWSMALTVVLSAIFMGLVAPQFTPLFAKAQKQLDRLNEIFSENISGVRIVKSFNRKKLERARFGKQNENLYDAQLKPGLLLALYQPMFALIINSSLAAALYVAGPEIARGAAENVVPNVTPGELATFFNYLLTAMIPVIILGWVIPELGRFDASLERIMEVVDIEADIKRPAEPIDPGTIEGHITFENVSMGYLDDDSKITQKVINGVDLEVEAGETLAILGQTGSGKTTLINLISRFYDVTEGSVKIDGNDVRDLDLELLRPQIAYASQRPQLLSGTFRENLAFGNETATDKELLFAAEIADAAEFIEEAGGLDAEVAEAGKNLSGGQRQRLSLARAIASKPRILILDDTTSAVDVATEARIQTSLKKHLDDVTIIMVAQRISTAIGADKIILLSSGQITAIGTHAQLMQTSAEYVEIIESQLGGPQEINEVLELL